MKWKGAYRGSEDIGVWRSLVARTLGVGEAVGSNPATPIDVGLKEAREKSAH